MSSVLMIALLGLAFLAMLKVAEWAQREPSQRAEDSGRRRNPTLDEIMEDVESCATP
jgi:hypothetical protein